MAHLRRHCQGALAALGCVAAVVSSAPSPRVAQSDAKRAALVAFERFEAQLAATSAYRSDPDNAALPWSESYLLQAYASAYAATGDPRWSRRLVERFSAILGDRDHLRSPPVLDHFTRRSAPAWGTARYTQGRHHVWAVHTAMICLGPADLACELRRSRRSGKWTAAVAGIVEAVEQAIAAHDDQWRWGPRRDEGHYVDPAIGVLPLNQQNAVGSVLLLLHRLSGDPDHLRRAAALARYFRNRVRPNRAGGLDWAYQPGIEGNRPGYEDISHAAINVEFAVRCADAGVVFHRDDLRRLGITWDARVRKGSRRWSDTLEGARAANAHVPQAIGRWLALAPYAPGLRQDAAEFDHLRGASAVELLGLANRLRYGAIGVSGPP
jgi:hypothetical protein